MTAVNEKLLDGQLAALEAARSWSPRLVSKLENHIRSAGDVDLLRVNPFKFAADRSLAEAETIDLFLHATALGLFEMNWVILCPRCSCVIDSFRALKNLDSHCRCTICQIDLVADLDDMIAVGFTVSPSIRRIAYHDPGSLSAADYYYRYKSTMEGLVPDGTPFTVIKEHGTQSMSFIEPGETVWLDASADAGIVRGYSQDADALFILAVDPALSGSPVTRSVRFDGEACDPIEATMPPGKVTVELTNTSGARKGFGLIAFPPGFAMPPLHFAPFLSGKQLLTTQTFRDLFRSEVIRGSEGIGVKDIALIFTDLKGSTALYDRIGDLNAFALVQQHFEQLQNVTVRNSGAIIKTIGDAVMAAFLNPVDAVRAALEMRREINIFNRGNGDKELVLKVGVHKGAAIAVTLNERLDYFGQTVNIAARVQNLAEADEIYLSKDVHDSPDVGALLADMSVQPIIARLRGVQEEVPVFRIARPATEARIA